MLIYKHSIWVKGTIGTLVLYLQICLCFFQDALGNKVWICPSCKGPDDGRPMIGCDDCDAWYHWYVSLNIYLVYPGQIR